MSETGDVSQAYDPTWLGRPRKSDRGVAGRGGPSKVRLPSRQRQVARLSRAIRDLGRAISADEASLGAVPGWAPERVLVLEIADSVEDFVRAVQRVPGLDLLFEFEERDVPIDDDFYDTREDRESIGGMLYLLMATQDGVRELAGLWRTYQEEGEWPYGQTKFRDVFARLRNIRPWGIQDWLGQSGLLEDWAIRSEQEESKLPAEVELWYRGDVSGRERAARQVQTLVEERGGSVLKERVIPEIGYHALLVEFAPEDVGMLREPEEVRLLRAPGLLMMRPVGQATTVDLDIQDVLDGGFTLGPLPEGESEPAVALLDGLPLEQHPGLAGRLLVDDPDDIESSYLSARERVHGTAMSFLVANGDVTLADAHSLQSRLYVRPILRPEGPDWAQPRREVMPSDELPVDLVHRAFRRMFEGDGDDVPRAPNVECVVLPIGDPSAPFVTRMSPFARLLDWLADRYSVAIVVSAGNWDDAIQLPVDPQQFQAMGRDEREESVLHHLGSQRGTRRIMSPSESFNALTVGASVSGGMGPQLSADTIELLETPSLPATYSSHGLGYRRSIKPDVLFPGGRGAHRISDSHNGVNLESLHGSRSGGHVVPSPVMGTVAVPYTVVRGTSNATSLAGHLGGLTQEYLSDLLEQERPGWWEDAFVAPLIKAIVAHGARWGEAGEILKEAFAPAVGSRKIREYVSRFIGVGSVSERNPLECSASSIVLLACGHVAEDEADHWAIPLPPSLSGHVGERRLTVTLAWLSAANPRNQKYRRAKLWFEVNNQLVGASTRESDHNAVRRGTLQHETFVGDRATGFADGEFVDLSVHCAQDAGRLTGDVGYAAVVRLESADGSLPIYSEVRDRVTARIQAEART